jgi:dihydroflavonol-4-reductase
MVAVTGANGLLGSFIIRALHQRNIPFVALKRKNSDTSLLADLGDQVTWRTADLLDAVGLEEVLRDVTAVIHAAAIVSFNPRKARAVIENNVQSTRNLVNECLTRGIPTFIHVSSVAALGRQRNQRFVDETNQWVDNPMNTAYAKSKYLSELEVYRAQEEGMRTAIVNPSVILAPGDWNRSSGKVFRYVWDEKTFYSDAYLNYVDVRDVADITVRLLNSDISGERFVLSAGSIHVRELFSKIAQRFGKRPPGVRLSPFLLGTLARLESVRSRFTGKEPLITRETARLAGTEFVYGNAKIKNALSVEFQPIDETLDWCCQYYLSRNGFKN